MDEARQPPETAPPDPWRRPVRYQPLVIVLAAMAAGIFADRHGTLTLSAWWAVACAAGSGWLGLWRSRRDTAAAFVLLVAVAATAAAWHHLHWHIYPADDLARFASEHREPVCLDAVVLTAPRVRPMPPHDPMHPIPAGARVQFDVAPAAVRDRRQWRPASGRAQITVYAEVDGICVGDRVRILGRFARPAPARNPGEFDYANYLRTRRVLVQLSTSYAESVSVVKPGSPASPARWLARLRARSASVLRRNVPEHQSALAEAVLLGARERIDPEETQLFVETGTVHLLAISGLHVGILMGALWYLLRRSLLPPVVCVAAAASLALVYMLLVDARPPVVRATMLVLVYCASLHFRRPALGFNALAAAGLIVLAWNPADLFHTGAQMSFLAVATLTWIAPLWIQRGGRQDWLSRAILAELPWFQRILWFASQAFRHLLAVSLLVWCVTAPLFMGAFHVLSPVGVPLNTVLWLPMTMALVGSFLTLVFSPISGLLSRLAGAVSGGAFGLLQGAVQWAHGLPASHLFVPGPPAWWVAGFYGGLLLFVAVPRIRPPRRWCLALACAWMAVGLTFPLRPPIEQRPLRCTFVALGHGLSVLVELPDGRAMLYDAGRMGPPMTAAQSISAVLWSRGIAHLDAVFLSHGDLDHYNALPRLLKRFSVGKVYVPPTMYARRNVALDALEEAIRESGVEQQFLWAGYRLAEDDWTIEVLHPPRKGVLGSDNANSLVLAVEHAGRRILLTGDLESPGLDDLIAEEPFRCDVLLAPHHGGEASNIPGLAQWSSPAWVVVSGARTERSFQQLNTTYAAVGATVLATDELGAITVEARRDGVRAFGFLSPP